MSGYIDWNHDFLADAFYLNGRTFDVGFEELAGGISWTDDDGVVVLESHAGTGIVQGFYRGEKAPVRLDRKKFSLSFLADSEEDFLHFEVTKALARPVFFCPHLWATDTWVATAGSTYTLSRPLAAGIIPGLAEPEQAPRVFVDGERDDDAAAVAGQTVTASASGELSVYYLAAFRVVVLGVSRDVTEYNKLLVRAQLREIIQGAF